MIGDRRGGASTPSQFEGTLDDVGACDPRPVSPDAAPATALATRPARSLSDTKRARRVWEDLELGPIGLHEARNTYASIAIASGVNAKSLCTYMGHSSITVTYDRYGHLMPGNEDQALELMDAYLERDR